MNLQQLRYVREAVRQGLNLTEAARALHTSQPGISKQIRDLEEELGIQIFVRRGKRLVEVTQPGRAAVEVIDRLLLEAENLRNLAREYADQDAGALTIATTHTQARYALPPVIRAFRAQFPKVRLSLQQGSPVEIAESVIAGHADIGVATEALDRYPQLLALPAYRWHHCVVMPASHPLAGCDAISLEALSAEPLITYTTAFAGRSHIDAAFAARGLPMNVVLGAIDADVIKTYVELGLGVGIIAAMAFDPERDRGLHAIDAAHLFQGSTTRVAIRRDAYLRRYTYAFIERVAPQLTRELIDQSRRPQGDDDTYEL